MIKEQIINLIRKNPLTRKEIIVELPNINENTLDVVIHHLKKKKIIKKKDKKYYYVNPFSKIFKMKKGSDRDLAFYRTLLKLITPFALYKPLLLLREAVYLNDMKEVNNKWKC